MRLTGIDRRRVLLGGLSMLAAPLPAVRAWAQSAGTARDLFASACRMADGQFSVVLFDDRGTVVRTLPLPDRGHDIVQAADRRLAVAFARRPGTFAVSFDLTAAAEPQLFSCPSDRHFFGHGVFSPDGRLLYATENDFAGARGVIGVYDATDRFRRIGEIPTYGVGPHELLLLADGRTLVVANGGIETHPDSGRMPLNIASMKPSVVMIERDSGALLQQFLLEDRLHQLSLRHMALGGDGDVWVGAQYEGPADELPPLVMKLSRDEGFTKLKLPEEVQSGLRNYIGSVAVSRDGSLLAASAPRGNTVLLFSADGGFLEAKSMRDACGLAPGPHAGHLTMSGGAMLMDLPDGAQSRASVEVSFDNHMVRII